MPRALQDAVHQIHTGLSVVGAGQQLSRPPKLESILAVEMAQVDLYQIAEALVWQQNFGARIDARHPRRPALAFLKVDEARLRTTRCLHQSKEGSDIVLGWLTMKGQRVVGLLTVKVVVDPEVFLGCCEGFPLEVIVWNESNFR